MTTFPPAEYTRDKLSPEQLDLAVWPTFVRMSRRGLRVDNAKLLALREEVQLKLDAEQQILNIVAGRELNPHSSHDVARWLTEANLLSGKRTKGGAPSTDERSLTLLADRSPVPGVILECRGLRKLLATFIEPVLDKTMHGDPVIHPRWRLTKTRSGRPSMEDPNLLAFPTRDYYGKRVRECFVARPGHKLISIDFSQIEPRVGTALSKDPGLLKVYRDKLDLYADMARRIFRIIHTDTELKQDDQLSRRYRQPAKIIFLGAVMYGMQHKHLYEEFLRWGVGTPSAPFFSEGDCEDFVRRRFEPYPALGELVNRTVRAALQSDGWALTHGGRGRFVPALLLTGNRWPATTMRAEAERQTFNHLIQGTAQEIMKEAMLRVEAADLPGLWALLQVYDELVFEVVEALADETKRRLIEIMSTVFEGVAIPAGGSVSASWGGLK